MAKKKMDDTIKAKLIYMIELFVFSILFLVLGILIFVGVILKTDNLNSYLLKYKIFTWVTLFGGILMVLDFAWALFSKKRRNKISLLDKALVLPVSLFLIVFDIYTLIMSFDSVVEAHLNLFRYVIGANFIYLSVVYVFEGVYHWFKPIPGLIEVSQVDSNHIDVKIFENDDDLGYFLANKIKELVASKPNAVLGFATGMSPLSTYKELVKIRDHDNLSFSNVVTFNLDEYINCSIKEQTYREFMQDNLFKYLDLNEKNIHFPSEDRPEVYDDLIDAMGGIDLQILGIGVNGHIAFNEPGTKFNSLTHKVHLSESTREANKHFFNDDLSLVPTEAVTEGLSTIMKAKEIYLIANTASKKVAIESLLKKPASEKCPASVLRSHFKVTILLTKDVNVNI